MCIRDRGLCVLCAVATLVRPYEAVLWLFPLALCRQDRRRIAVCVAGGTVSLGGTLVLMSKFYAPYFFTNVDVSPLQELARGQVVSAVRDVAHKLLDALRTVAEMLADQLANRSGGQYLLFFLLLGVTLVCLIVDARAGRPVFWKGCAAVTAVIVFLALLLMYRPVEGSRHTLVLDVLLLAALLLLGALSGCGSVLDALEDRLETTAEPEPSLPTGDYLTEGLYFYGSWRADTDYSDMYAYSDLDYFRSLGEELLSVAASGPDEEALYDACFAFTDEFYYIRTASDLRLSLIHI